MDCCRCHHDYKRLFRIETIQEFKRIVNRLKSKKKKVVVILEMEEYPVTGFRKVNFGWSLLADFKVESYEKQLTVGDMQRNLQDYNNWTYLRNHILATSVNKGRKSETAWCGIHRIDASSKDKLKIFVQEMNG